MNVNEIKEAVKAGRKVYWSNKGYEVRRAADDWYYILCTMNNSIIGLTDVSGKILNGDPSDFFTE